MKLLRYPDLVAEGVGHSRMTLKRLIDTHGFPPGKLITPNARAWREDEVDKWVAVGLRLGSLRLARVRRPSGGATVMTAPESERAAIRAEWPTEFNDGARCGFSSEFDGPREQGGYPVGFHKWPLECRTAWTKGSVTKRAAKMIERPDYYTKEQWQEYLRTAKSQSPRGARRMGKPRGSRKPLSSTLLR